MTKRLGSLIVLASSAYGLQCPNGHVSVPVVLPEISANGCGPMGMQIEEEFGLFLCCNRHDVCYQSCGASFRYCEKIFDRCMTSVCDQKKEKSTKKECREQAKFFTSMTGAFGKGLHEASQEGVCECVPASEADERYESFLTTLSREDEALDTSSLLKKYEGKRGKMVYRALKSFKDHAVTFVNIKPEL